MSTLIELQKLEVPGNFLQKSSAPKFCIAGNIGGYKQFLFIDLYLFDVVVEDLYKNFLFG